MARPTKATPPTLIPMIVDVVKVGTGVPTAVVVVES
jgi:hypothetical protein